MSSLYHEGILGQKWGVRHGPPYPLGYSAHSAKQKRLNSKSRIDGNPETGGNGKRKGLTDKQKTAIKIGMAAIGTALVAYGGYKIATSPKTRALMRKGMDAIGKRQPIDFDNFEPEIVKKNGAGSANIVPSPEIVDYCLESGFPLKPDLTVRASDLNPDYHGGTGNCGMACTAGMLDYQGVANIKARREMPISIGGGSTLTKEEVAAMWKKNGKVASFESVLVSRNNKENVVNRIKKMTGSSERACGYVHLGNANNGAKHFFAWYKEDGNVIFHDELFNGDDSRIDSYFKIADLGLADDLSINSVYGYTPISKRVDNVVEEKSRQ